MVASSHQVDIFESDERERGLVAMKEVSQKQLSKTLYFHREIVMMTSKSLYFHGEIAMATPKTQHFLSQGNRFGDIQNPIFS